jgi:Cu2+-exporting ATPase
VSASVTAIAVEDMHCSACTGKIEKALGAIAGVTRMQFNPVRRHVVIEHANTLPAAELIRGIESAGFHPALLSNSGTGERAAASADRTLLKRLGIAGLAMMQVMMVQIALYAGAFQGMEPVYTRLLEYTALAFCIPVVSYSAMPFFVSAAVSLRRGLNMDAPIALAIVIAFSASLWATLTGEGEVYYDSVVMFTFLMLGARYLEQRLKLRLQIEDSLLAALPREVRLIEDGAHRTVPLRDTGPGDRVWVGEGEQLPGDGLLEAPALLEEAMLTGESDWARKPAGAPVFAGTFNRGAGFAYTLTATGDDARIGQIDRLAAASLSDKHALARMADRVARYFIPGILSIAAITYAIWWQVDPGTALPAMLAVLVVSCPCALSLATPAAITAAMARLRQAGVLIKDSAALERARGVQRVFIDKTGTLTSPDFRVTDQHTLPGYSATACLDIARALQAHAAHPLARAFSHNGNHLETSGVTVQQQGVQGEVGGVPARIGSAAFAGWPQGAESHGKQVYLSLAGDPAASFTVTAPLRGDAAPAIQALKRFGLDVQMLSGDDEAHCAEIARVLDIRYRPSLTPEQKNDALRNAASTMFVGDGINDIPAITRAGLSVSTLETNDLVKSRADVVLLTPRLLALADIVRVGHRANRIMRENLAWALGYNLLAIPAAALGYAPPWAAALGMSASSILVMLNAMRLLRTPLHRRDEGGAS